MQHDPYRLLAAMVVQRAISDIATAVPERGYAHVMTVQAEDARDFLQRRLWEPGNWWGEQLADLLGQAEVKVQILRYCVQAQVRPMQRRGVRGQRVAVASPVVAEALAG